MNIPMKEKIINVFDTDLIKVGMKAWVYIKKISLVKIYFLMMRI